MRHVLPPTGIHDGRTLTDAIRLWPTPATADSERGSDFYARREGNPTLVGEARIWTTPTAHDVRGRMSVNRKYPGLPDDVALWATPQARDGKGAFQAHTEGGTDLSLQARQSAMPGQPSSKPTRTLPLLSPLFTEWLMGLPFGWTALSASPPSAMPSYLSAQRSLLSRLLANSGLAEVAAAFSQARKEEVA